MGNVSFKLDANADKVVQAAVQSIDQMQRLTDAIDRMNAKGQQSHGVFEKMGTDTVHHLEGMVTGFFSVGAAIEAAHRALELMGQEQERLHKQSEGYTQQLARDAAAQGDVANWKKIDTFLKSDVFADTGTTMEDRQRAMRGVRRNMPLAAFDEVEPGIVMAARAGKAGYDREEFGQRVGELATLMPHATEAEWQHIGDVAAQTIGAQGRLGEKFDAKGIGIITQYAATGHSVEEGVKIVEASMAAHQGTRAAAAYVDSLTEHKDFFDVPGKMLTVEDQMKRRWNSASAAEREKMALDPDYQRAIYGANLGPILAMKSQLPQVNALMADTPGRLNREIAEAGEDERWGLQQTKAGWSGSATAKELKKPDPFETIEAIDEFRRNRGDDPIDRAITKGLAKLFVTLGAGNQEETYQKQMEAAKALQDSAANLKAASEKPANRNAQIEVSGGTH